MPSGSVLGLGVITLVFQARRIPFSRPLARCSCQDKIVAGPIILAFTQTSLVQMYKFDDVCLCAGKQHKQR